MSCVCPEGNKELLSGACTLSLRSPGLADSFCSKGEPSCPRSGWPLTCRPNRGIVVVDGYGRDEEYRDGGELPPALPLGTSAEGILQPGRIGEAPRDTVLICFLRVGFELEKST